VDSDFDRNSGPSASDASRGKRGNTVAWLIFCAAALAFAIVYGLGGSHDPAGGHPAVGRRLPQLELKPLTGGGSPVSLVDLEGRVTLLDFWGTWCGPCVEEVPHLAVIAEKFRGHADFLMLPVSCGGGGREDFAELAANTQAFLTVRQLTMPTYIDPGGYSRHGVDMVAGFQGYPTTIVLDRRGVIRGFWIGYYGGDERQVEKLVGELLDEKKP